VWRKRKREKNSKGPRQRIPYRVRGYIIMRVWNCCEFGYSEQEAQLLAASKDTLHQITFFFSGQGLRGTSITGRAYFLLCTQLFPPHPRYANSILMGVVSWKLKSQFNRTPRPATDGDW